MRAIPAVVTASAALLVFPLVIASCEEGPAKAPPNPPPPPTVTAPPTAAIGDAGSAAPSTDPFAKLGKYPDSVARYREWLKNLPAPCAPLPPPRFEKTATGYKEAYALGCIEPVLMSYPTVASLPEKYWTYYPDVFATIQHYTLQSLQRDGITDATVKVIYEPLLGLFFVAIESASPNIQGYGSIHPKFVDPMHGAQSAVGAQICQQCTDCSMCPSLCEPLPDGGGTRGGPCWNPPGSDPTWAMFLPLGLPMLTQQTVLFLDYPPLTSLTQDSGAGHGDYLDNYTMCRWGRVLNAAGAVNPTQYETIVDSRPVAAGGSGMDNYLPVPQTTYNSPRTGGAYLTPMLQLLASPDASAPATLPVAVFGYTARQTWGQMANDGGMPAVLQVGTTNILGPSTAWISTNHPDVTSYECCSGDPYSSCKGSTALLSDEQKDFVAACWMQSMGANPTANPATTETTCAGKWMPTDGGVLGLDECIQEKLDDNDPNAVCCTWQDAWTYCTQHGNNACATNDCTVSAKVRLKAPPTPPQQQDTCNEMRFYPDSKSGKIYCSRCPCPPSK